LDKAVAVLIGSQLLASAPDDDPIYFQSNYVSTIASFYKYTVLASKLEYPTKVEFQVDRQSPNSKFILDYEYVDL